eukprot:gene7124-11287_t
MEENSTDETTSTVLEVEPKEQTPLPKIPIFIIYLINLFDRLSVVSLFPYISQLTIDLLNLDEKKDAKLVGFYSRFIVSSYFITQLFSHHLIYHQRLGLEPYKIGILQGSMGIFLLLCQLFLIHRFIDRFGIIGSFQIATFFSLPPLFGIPEVYRISQLKTMEWLVWLLIFLQIVWKQVWNSMMFTSAILMVNNCVPKEDLGKLNGIAQSFVALTRAIGPSIATPIFALSISNNMPYPFDVHLIFYLAAFISLIVFPLTFLLPNRK